MRFLLLIFLTTSFLSAQNESTQFLKPHTLSGKLSKFHQEQLVNYLNEKGLSTTQKDTLLIDLGTTSSNIRNMTNGHYENYKALIASKNSIKHIEFIDEIPKRQKDKKKFKNQIIDEKSTLKKIFFSSHKAAQQENLAIYASTIMVYPDGTFFVIQTDDIITIQRFLEKMY